MPRVRRMLIEDQPTVYHVMSRTCLPGYPLGEVEKEYLLKVIQRFGKLYFTEILGFCLMGNHFHLLVRMLPEDSVSSDKVLNRYRALYGENAYLSDERERLCRRKWSSLSEFVREIKQTFSRFYNKRHTRRGFFWGERYKSVIVENGRTLINCLAYIDLNPIRAGLVQRPEEYRWCSLAYHAQTGNKSDFLSLDFGLADWGVDMVEDRLQRYRAFVYETGALDSGKGDQLEERIVQRARDKNFEYTTSDRFVMRTRWFTDSTILGTSEFVRAMSQKLKLPNAEARAPKHVAGVEDVYSYRRLAELL